METNDLRIELRFKNAVLGRALAGQFGETARRIQSGPQLPLIKVASEAIGVTGSKLSSLLNLKSSPWNKQGERNLTAEKIAAALCLDFDELFPSALYSGTFASAKVAEMSSARLLPLKGAMRLLSSDDIEAEYQRKEQLTVLNDVLNGLKLNEKQVLEMRFGLNDNEAMTLQRVADEFGLSKDRIRQIEAKALRKMRHPERSNRLIEAGFEA